jgi:SAM-dependent methyltransferase
MKSDILREQIERSELPMSGDHPNTYFVQDRGNQDEMTRIEIQDKMLTQEMGGALPELSDHAQLRQILDVGCGTGGWLMEAAKAYPSIERLVGIDKSPQMIAYANAQAKAQHLDERVSFQTMDALRTLEFPVSTFDLVNQRATTSWLPTWQWKPLLQEYQRVSRSGGIIRITEANLQIESTSPALTKLCRLAVEANYHAGRLWAFSGDGVTHELVRVMTEHGIENVQTRTHSLIYRVDTEMGRLFSEDMARLFRVGVPFLQKWTHVSDDYQEIYQQALEEMRQPGFVATWTLVTSWGYRH